MNIPKFREKVTLIVIENDFEKKYKFYTSKEMFVDFLEFLESIPYFKSGSEFPYALLITTQLNTLGYHIDEEKLINWLSSEVERRFQVDFYLGDRVVNKSHPYVEHLWE